MIGKVRPTRWTESSQAAVAVVGTLASFYMKAEKARRSALMRFVCYVYLFKPSVEITVAMFVVLGWMMLCQSLPPERAHASS